MDDDLLRQILGSTVVASVVGAIFLLIGKLRENRTTLRLGAEQAMYDRGVGDAEWNASYRTAAEGHLDYDVTMRECVQELRSEVNLLRRQLGLEPHEWPPLPKAPSLFPPPLVKKEVLK